MGDYLMKVTLPYLSGAATDVSVNDYSIQATDHAAAAVAGAAITNVYTTVGTGAAGSFGRWLSGVISRAAGACVIRGYDRAEPPKSPPFYVATFTLPAGINTTACPGEVALCGSLLAGTSPIVNNRRRRGRIYFGPFVRDASSVVGTKDQPDPVMISDLTAVLADLLAASTAAGSWAWQVWSQADGVGRDITDGYVDNAWDTRRSRGTAPTSRSTF